MNVPFDLLVVRLFDYFNQIAFHLESQLQVDVVIINLKSDPPVSHFDWDYVSERVVYYDSISANFAIVTTTVSYTLNIYMGWLDGTPLGALPTTPFGDLTPYPWITHYSASLFREQNFKRPLFRVDSTPDPSRYCHISSPSP